MLERLCLQDIRTYFKKHLLERFSFRTDRLHDRHKNTHHPRDQQGGWRDPRPIVSTAGAGVVTAKRCDARMPGG